ncbi:beta 1-4 rhamnosyltransferase Cps2T [Enterococcus innesii]
MTRSVYIIGSKGIPAKYGGFETFVEKLTEFQKSEDIHYFVACMKSNSDKSQIKEDIFEYNGATCFNIEVPNVGPAKAILYDILALRKAIKISKKNRDENPIFYILACRIGPLINYFKKTIDNINGQLFVNPDGHEWLRKKWSKPVRMYWKLSEKMMVKKSDLMICDSKNIEKYILKEYQKYNPTTIYIAYGTDLTFSTLNRDDSLVRNWYFENNVLEEEYYLVVGRFVPENNYETMIKEFMLSKTKKSFILISNVENNKFFDELKHKTNFHRDERVKFVGTVYNQQLLKYIRENAYAYFHGHEVGGTNPSLLESLASTKLNLLLNVGFNKEVAGEGALYWEKNNLNELINLIESKDFSNRDEIHLKAYQRVNDKFTWDIIVKQYENLLGGHNGH